GDTAVGVCKYVNWSPATVAEVPPAVVTVTSTVPVPAGLKAMICVFEPLAIEPDDEPNLTAVAAARVGPEMATCVPPATEPADGAMLVTIGTLGQTRSSRSSTANDLR